MKRIVIGIASIAALVLASSCNKMDNPGGQDNSPKLMFTANIDEGISKGLLGDGGRLNWQETDEVYINGSRFSVIPHNPATVADLVLREGETAPVAPYKSLYAAGFHSERKGVYRLYPTQDTEYTDGKFNVPMFASGSSETLSFKNICGVICLNLTGTDLISRVIVKTTGELVSGLFTIDESNYKISMLPGEGYTESDLYLGEGGHCIQLNTNTPTKVYIYLPPNEYAAGLTITLVPHSGETDYKKISKFPMKIERGHIYNIDWHVNGPKPDYLPGKFSVSPGYQMHFAKGNLYYDGSAYKFENRQCDFPRTWDKNHIGHFFWSKSAEKARAEYYDHDEECSSSDVIFTNSAYETPSSSFTVNGVTGRFRCLSETEWNYLLRERRVNGGTGKGYSYSIEKNFSVEHAIYHGIVLFPDNFTKQANWKDYYKTWEDIDYSGIVFLPILGYRDKEEIGEQAVTMEKVDKWGTYMSSKPYTDSKYAWFGVEYYDEKDDLEKLSDNNPPYRQFGYGYRLVIKL